jgi:hypothetical protein
VGKQETATEKICDRDGPERVCYQKIDTGTFQDDPVTRCIIAERSHECDKVNRGGDQEIDEYPGKTTLDIGKGIPDTAVHA